MNLTLELSGLNLERLLRTAGENGVRLQNVRRADERTMRVTVSAAQKGKLAALCGRYGWQMTEVRADWPLRLIRTMKRRWTLGAAMLLSVFWVFVSSEMIWRVEITGAGENIAEVRRCLARENARVGRLKKRVSTDRLAAELALAVPGLSHAAARYEGSTLVVACQQAREGERAGVDGTGRDIVAAREGIIIRISAESGTPRVKAGQAVREGQTLIAGQERTGGGNLRACRAQGEIIARCFARGEARVRLNVTGTVETGEVRRRVILERPTSRRVVQDAEDFDRQDVSVELQPIVGLYLPVWRRVETQRCVIRSTMAMSGELPPEEDVLAACETDRHYQRFLGACKERYDRYLKVIELFRSPSASLERAHEEALALSAMPFGGRLS